MTRRGVRLLVAAVLITAVSAAMAPAIAATFGAPHPASAHYAWNPGKSLVATDTKLLSIWASDCPPPLEKCASDDGPHMGVFVQRSPAGAVPPSWSKPLRLSPPSVHAERPSIAAHGTTVIASWVTQRSYGRYRPGAPRALWLRVSRNEGKSWGQARRLSPINGRVDYPRVAIGGGRLFAVWTSSDNGALRLAHSDDNGGHWAKVTIAQSSSTPFGAGEGYAGLPDIGASGANLAIAWIATDTGIQRAFTSATGGDDLAGATPETLSGRSRNDGQHYPAVGGATDPADPRVAIGGGRLFAVWTSSDTGAIRFAHSDDNGGHWAKATIAQTPSTPFGAGEGYAGLPDIGASGTNLAIAWIGTDTGVQRAFTSAVGGDDLVGATPEQLSGRSRNDGQHYPAVEGATDPADPRVTIAYSTSTSLELRTYDGVTLGAPSTVFAWDTTIQGTRFVDGYGPAVLPMDPGRIAVAVAGCRQNTVSTRPCDPFAVGSRIDVLYVETPDDGATWEAPMRLTDATRGTYRTNDEPSLARTGSTVRVAFDRYQPSFSDYAVWLRSST